MKVYLMCDNAKVLELYNQGYRVVSRKHQHASRVDISDEEMMAFFLKENYGHKSGTAALDLEHARDQYRRVYSKDVIRLPSHAIRTLLDLTNAE